MVGQEAVAVAEAFHAATPVSGLVLTKIDGDARGGAALSISAVSGVAVKFMGTGEKTDALEVFHPDRLAGRILGMGDVVSLVERAQEAYDAKEAERLAEKLRKNSFTLDDFLDQMQQVKKMGPLGSLMEMIPGFGGAAKQAQAAIDRGELARVEAIIRSMTREERNDPGILNASRRRRIARGSGTSLPGGQSAGEAVRRDAARHEDDARPWRPHARDCPWDDRSDRMVAAGVRQCRGAKIDPVHGSSIHGGDHVKPSRERQPQPAAACGAGRSPCWRRCSWSSSAPGWWPSPRAGPARAAAPCSCLPTRASTSRVASTCPMARPMPWPRSCPRSRASPTRAASRSIFEQALDGLMSEATYGEFSYTEDLMPLMTGEVGVGIIDLAGAAMMDSEPPILASVSR